MRWPGWSRRAVGGTGLPDRTTSVEHRSATSFGLSHGLSTEIVVAAHKNSK
jgi:hypothetical protein